MFKLFLCLSIEHVARPYVKKENIIFIIKIIIVISLIVAGGIFFDAIIHPPQKTCYGSRGKLVLEDGEVDKGYIDNDGGCVALGGYEGTATISGTVKNHRGGIVKGGTIELMGAGCNNMTVSDENGNFMLTCDFNLEEAPYDTAVLSLKKDCFIRKDITIIIKSSNEC